MRVEKITRRSRKLVALLLAALFIVPTTKVRGQTLLHTINNPAVDDTRFGQGLTSLGDVDGDGAPDFAVGAPMAGQGQVYIVSGGQVIRTLDHTDTQAPFSSANFGWAVVALGDVNGDGTPDVAVGAPGQSEMTAQGFIFPGRVSVFSADGTRLYSVGHLPSNPNLQLTDSAMFGWTMAVVGDLDNDGVRELAVGAPGYGVNSEGRVFVFSGASGALIHVLDNPTQVYAFFGSAVAGIGDVNEDGVDDIAVGAPDYNDGRGRVYLFSGFNGSLLGVVDNPIPNGAGVGANFGEALTVVGDVNGDGRADLAVGAPNQNRNSVPRAGAVFIFLGVPFSSAGAYAPTPLVLDLPVSTVDPVPMGASFGQWLAAVGDYDGDGVPDIVVAAPNYSVADPDDGRPIDTGSGVGRVFVFSGAVQSLALLETLANPLADEVNELTITPNANFGLQAVVVENANGGDRYLAVSAPGQFNQAGQVGQVFVYSLPAAAPPEPPRDTTAPTLSVPATLVVEATSPSGAVVTYPSFTVSDDQDPAPVVTCVPASGSTFALGSSTVRCTAADRAGNTSPLVTFSVVVRDSTPPNTLIEWAKDGQQKPVSNGSTTLSNAITFKFGGTDVVGVAGYYCSWDGGAYSPCTSPLVRSGLTTGRHTFGVKAYDGAHLVDGTPATLTWTILTRAEAARELKEAVEDLDLRRREHAKLSALLREIKHRLSNRKVSDDRKACDELDAFLRLLGSKERAGVITTAQAAPLRQLAESLRLSIGCGTARWHAKHHHYR